MVIATLDALAAACLEACKKVTGELQGDTEGHVPDTVIGMTNRHAMRLGSMFEMGQNDLQGSSNEPTFTPAPVSPSESVPIAPAPASMTPAVTTATTAPSTLGRLSGPC